MVTLLDSLSTASKKFVNGDYDGAINVSNKVLNLHQDCIEALLLRGKAFWEKGYLGPSIRDFNIVLKLDSHNVEARELLIKAEARKEELINSLKSRREVHGFRVLRYLGSGWEGAVYLVCDDHGKKQIVKSFYDYRVEKLNSETIGMYRKPVAGSKNDLLRLSACSIAHHSDTIYPITLLKQGEDIIGVLYEYEKLINISRRYLDYPGVRLFLMRAFLETQGYLLRNLELVMVDASIDQFMISRDGRLKFVDYGGSINPINDFRCQEEHWEIVTLIKLLYQLFKPEKRHCFKSSNFSIVCDLELGLADLVDSYPFIGEIIDKIAKSDFDPFVDFRFYEKIAESLPNKLNAITVLKINSHQLASHLKRLALRR